MIYHPPPHVTQHWSVTKPAATGRRGMVVSQSRDAAAAGVAILDAGGNAVDAAVGTALALATVEPWNSGLGGIGFAVVHRAGQAAAETVDFGPVAPSRLNPDAFRLTGEKTTDLFAWPGVVGDANIHGPLSFAIPSSVAGYAHMHARWGVLPLTDVMAPALALAKRGLSQDWFTTLKIASSASVLAKYTESASIYLPGGMPPVPPYQGVPGYFRQGNLADTLDRLAHAGLRDFYEGDVAATLVDDFGAVGSVLTAEDLRRCEARVLPVMAIPWRGRTILLPIGLTAGPTFRSVLEGMRDVSCGETPDAAWFAALARTMKAAYAERLAGLGETEPMAAESCTTHLTVCDAEGTMVAVTTTLLSSMGSRVVLPKSGVLMNNGVMWFDPRPGQPNSVAPGKRPLTNMCPVIVSQGGVPTIAAGASGGRRIMAAVAQMLAFTLDFGMDPATAAHHPRIDVSDPDIVNADVRLPAGVLEALKADGEVEIVETNVIPINFACPNLIHREAGQVTGISDVMSPWSAAVAQA
jgi:gamma-glutamyltranspeptidase/glutathione hydrolase